MSFRYDQTTRESNAIVENKKKAQNAFEVFCGLQQYTQGFEINPNSNSKGTTHGKASNSKGTTHSKASNSKGTIHSKASNSKGTNWTGDNINNGGAPTVNGRYPWSGPPCQTRVYNTTPIVPESGRTINSQTRVYNTTPIVPPNDPLCHPTRVYNTRPIVPCITPTPPPNDTATPAVLEALDRIEKEVWSHLQGITKLESVQAAEALDKKLDVLEVGPRGTKSRQQRKKILNALDWIIRTMD